MRKAFPNTPSKNGGEGKGKLADRREDDYKIKEDFEPRRGAAPFPHAPLCQLSFSKRNEENESRQLKGTRLLQRPFDDKQGRKC